MNEDTKKMQISAYEMTLKTTPHDDASHKALLEHFKQPLTKRCKYCRPRWTFGISNKTARRIVEAIWPAHIIGPDYGAPYTDGMCSAAVKRENDAMDATHRARFLAWRDSIRKRVEANLGRLDTLQKGGVLRAHWIAMYQRIRRADLTVEI
jgi:hypothetical protein